MDLSILSTKEKAESGVWFPVKIHGKTIPVEVLIYGEDSDKVQKYNATKIKKLGSLKASLTNGEIDLEDIDIESLDTSIEDAVARTGGMKTVDGSPLTLGDKNIDDSDESYRYVYSMIGEIKKFVIDKSRERVNFLLGGKKSLRDL
jgi:hypothetical protein